MTLKRARTLRPSPPRNISLAQDETLLITEIPRVSRTVTICTRQKGELRKTAAAGGLHSRNYSDDHFWWLTPLNALSIHVR